MDEMTAVAAEPSMMAETSVMTESMDEMTVEAAEPSMMAQTVAVQDVSTIESTAGVADFVEPGVSISSYVDRYLHDDGFSAWYDQWYPDTPFYAAVGITSTEYQNIVKSITESPKCPAGTNMIDGMCVSNSAPTDTSAAREFEAQGGGLQIGVAAAAGFGMAIAVLLVLWLPSRVRRRLRNRHKAREA